MTTTLLIGFIVFVIVNAIIIRLFERKAKAKGNPRSMPYSKEGIRIHAILIVGSIIFVFGVLFSTYAIMVAGSIVAFIGLIPIWIDRFRRMR